MAAAILNQGKSGIRDALKSLYSYVGVSTDNTAFAAGQTRLDPSGTGTNLIKASTVTNSGTNGDQLDATITINGSTEFTNSTIFTIGLLNGSTTVNAQTRAVRAAGIGVQPGDIFTIGVRVLVQDNS